MHTKDLEKLSRFIEELNETSKTNEKKAVLARPEYRDDEFVRKALYYTYNDFKQYHLKPDNLKKNTNLVDGEFRYESFFQLLDDLHEGNISGHAAIGQVNKFIGDHAEYAEIIYNIFDRNLKTRMTESLVNKVIPGLIPTFDVALAEPSDKFMHKVDFDENKWLASRKLDGLRCICIVDESGEPKFYSRKGKEFLTLGVLKEEVKKLGIRNIVLDGEVCIVDENGMEDFTAIMKEYNRKDHTIEKPKYLLFDAISMEVFLAKGGGEPFEARYDYLTYNHRGKSEYVDVIEQTPVRDTAHLAELTDEAKSNGWEGIIIRKNVPYEGKRSRNMLKVKSFFDDEYVVTRTENGPFRVILDGKEYTEIMLSRVYIEHKGYEVGVGSGFSLEQRRHYRDHPEEIVGSEITVQYFGESKNQDGGLSLRFPTLKAIYDGERDV